ncbi:HAD family hydrolase [Flavobacterium inviolabile]|uniref:HAD family hydrolase n=1 Tax=Flavobacterium inviolabile TaxID=2748320 RepID=UPI0015A8DE20|nr:HAD-IA family hydrolase [Flavobacterium inviolabile]
MILSEFDFHQNYTTFLFDFDYTLADASKGIVSCFHIVLNRHGWTGITDEVIKKTIGMTLEDSFAVLTGIQEKETLMRLKQEYIEEADGIMSDNTFFYSDAIPFLTRLKDHQRQTGIISTKQRYIINESIVKNQVETLFDIVIGMEDVKWAKPDPEGLLTAMKRLNAVPEQTLYFGDNIIDAKAAQAAGVDFVGVTTGMTAKEDFHQYPYKKIVARLSDILPLKSTL